MPHTKIIAHNSAQFQSKLCTEKISYFWGQSYCCWQFPIESLKRFEIAWKLFWSVCPNVSLTRLYSLPHHVGANADESMRPTDVYYILANAQIASAAQADDFTQWNTSMCMCAPYTKSRCLLLCRRKEKKEE